PAFVWGTPQTNEFFQAVRTPAHARVLYGQPVDAAALIPATVAAGGPIDRAALADVSARLMALIRELGVQAGVLSGEKQGSARGSGIATVDGPGSDGGGGLQAVLARYPAIARPCREPEVLGGSGGLSGARLWRYESGRGRLLARAWPPEGPDRERLVQ